ncbi:MAG: class I SAM-dependent methyltransferase [Nitrosarchaeum sp.]
MNIDELKTEVEKIKWFHTIDLGNGIVTKGADNSPEKLKTIKMKGYVKGKTVLDIGAWDGFFSFEAEKSAATRVVAVDPYMWNGNQWGSKNGFALAKRVLNSKVQDVDLKDVSEITTLGSFDVVLFLGVFYHLKDPLVVLEKVAKITNEMLILETEIDMRNNDFPMMSFNYKKEVYADDTNYWFPNTKAVQVLLETVGFKEIQIVHKSDVLWRMGRAYLNRGTSKLSFGNRMKMGRAVFHAFK